ncbi:MAG: hypothetical protein A3C46_06935 [Deltaproteobacteria bacterium RIFCSPHIGHO2_02_FULL_44_16]|nr:MAG: hypothetical protein A3C46_06935 [Deltaproteobacteria bacterium RIFCSPHIGHO2_02_FULL_44_16]
MIDAFEKERLLARSKREIFFEYAVITFGSVIFALAVVLFLLPYQVAPGGVTGAAIIIHFLTHFPVGVTMFTINMVIFLLGLKTLGVDFTMKSIYASAVISFCTDLFHEVWHLQMPIRDAVLAPVFGGVVLGVGLGLIIRMGGGTSGSNTLARVISRYTNLKQGAAIFVINSGVIAAAGIIFKSADLALYGYVAVYTSSLVIDFIVEGFEYARGAYIISSRNIEIADMIVYEMGRGVTTLSGRGFYTQEDRGVLFTVMPRKEIHDLITIVKRIDPKAFVIIMPVHEVLGEGFKMRRQRV